MSKDIFGKDVNPGDFIISSALKGSINTSFYGIYISDSSCLTLSPYEKSITDRVYLESDFFAFSEYNNLKCFYKIEKCDDMELQIYNKLFDVYKRRKHLIETYESNKYNLPVGSVLYDRNWSDISIYLGKYSLCNIFSSYKKFYNIVGPDDGSYNNIYFRSVLFSGSKLHHVYLRLNFLNYQPYSLDDLISGRKCGNDLILMLQQDNLNIYHSVKPMTNQCLLCQLDIDSLFTNTLNELNSLKGSYSSTINPYDFESKLKLNGVKNNINKDLFENIVNIDNSSNLLIKDRLGFLVLS